MSLFTDTLDAVKPVDGSLEVAVRARLDSLTKPPGSLGKIEDLAARYCLARGTAQPCLEKKVIFTLAGDHGVTAEGVSAYPRDVTGQMVRNMLAGGAAVNVLARQAGAEVRLVDMGIAAPLGTLPGLIDRKVRPGTDNLAQGPAMSREEARQAVEAGIALAFQADDEGFDLLGTGEMGIGNTTPSAALLAVLLPCTPREAAGRGTGIDDETWLRKVAVIERAVAVNQAALTDPLGILAALGGFEIAGICGLILGAAAKRLPVVVDGFISSAGALAACRLCPAVGDYLFFSHRSAEAGHDAFFERLPFEPILGLGMRLGEGTGAALAMMLIEAAVRIYNEMATFAAAGVSQKEG